MAPTSPCSSCLAALRTRRVPRGLAEPRFVLAQRFPSYQQRARPSRMVLADQVHRSPQPRHGRRSPRTDPVAGPFAGMNRRVANIDPRRAPRPVAAAAAAATAGRTRTGSRDGRDGRERARAGDGDARKALKMQRALASIPYDKRNSIKERMLRFESFDEFDLLPAVKNAVLEELFRDMVDVAPTPIQRLAIPAMLGQPSPDEPKSRSGEMQSFLLAAETGSGKTLAYLLPAIDALKMAEAEDPLIRDYKERQQRDRELQEKQRESGATAKLKPLDDPHPTMARPRVVVLVPTAELAQQVARVAKTLSHVAKFKTDMLSSNLKTQLIQRNLYGLKGVDLIVSTPHLLASIVSSDPNVVARVSHLVIDEADSLLDRSFLDVTTHIVERAMPSLRQLVCCSATIPRKLNNYLAVNYPKMVRITTPNLHAISRRVQLGVVDVSKDPYRNNKDLACADAIYSIGRGVRQREHSESGDVDVCRILVFVNERDKTEAVAEYLRSKGIDAVALHRDAPERRPGETLEAFTSPAPMRIRALEKPGRKLENAKVLVVTDLASRGIDTLAVRHVILYDVPHTTIDFIHRLGRAGRMGRRGRGIVLAGDDDRKDVVAEVRSSMYMGQALI